MQSEVAERAVATGHVGTARPGIGLRLRGALLGLPCLGVLWLAHSLTPRQAGYGTHENLGLPACSFLSRTGYPCPSCGLTTSTAAVVHGEFLKAFHAHPMGFVLVAGLAAVGVLGSGELLLGRDFLRFLHPGGWWAVVALVALLGGWGFKIACGLSTGRLPVR